MATILLSASASLINDSAKYCVYESVEGFDLNCWPVFGSNLTTPENFRKYKHLYKLVIIITTPDINISKKYTNMD
jgi:hypothetical protein